MGNSSRGISIDELPKDLQRRARAIADAKPIPARDGGPNVLGRWDVPAPFIPAELGPNALVTAVNAAAKPRRGRAADLEHPIQVDVVAWADDLATLPQYPELKSLYAVPNAGGSGKSKRSRQIEGARKRAEGLRQGMPDLVLPTPRRDRDGRVYGALYIEMKDESGAVRKSQRDRIALLRAAGNKCEIAMSADAAKAMLTAYLHLSRP